jgi:hypothetical protein
VSIKIVTLAWDVCLPHAEKLVFLALADNANDERICWPSVATLGRKCGLEDRSIRRVIARLVDLGQVMVQAKPHLSNHIPRHAQRCGDDSSRKGRGRAET